MAHERAEHEAVMSTLKGDRISLMPPLPVGAMPLSIETVDLDNDLDDDLAIVADDVVIGPAVQIIENIATQRDEVAFDDAVAFGVEADPNFVLNADFNNDTLQDLVTTNADDGASGGSVTVLLNAPTPICAGDLDGGGAVGITDFLQLLANWGSCT